MIENPRPNIMRFVLPFSVLSENRKEPFTKEMERAAIFCSSELERAKGGGLILKQPPEKTLFVAEVSYPFWLTPWHELTLILDGLNMTHHVLTYQVFSNGKVFRDNMKSSSKALENYMDFLSDNINYLRTPNNQKQTVLNGLVTNPKLLNEFTTYLSEATQVETSPSDMIMLPPTIDETAVSTMKQELDSLKLEFQEEINNLYENMKFLSKTTNSFAKTIRAKIRTIQEEFNKEIRKVESTVTPKINRIQGEYGEQITTLTRKFEKQLLPVEKEKIKLEKTKQQKQNEIERYKIEARRCAARKDTVGEKKWKREAKDSQKELSELQTKTKELQTKIKEIEDNKSAETFNLRSEKETKINEAKKDLLELEASREAQIEIHRQEMEKLKELTSTIITQTNNAAKLRESNLAELEKLGLQQKRMKPSLIYMPFYLVCYQSESKKRYEIFPPSTVSSVSFSIKLKGALGKARIKKVLSSRFKNISSFLRMFPSMIERDAVLERELDEAGTMTNILETSIREQIRNGLESLKKEGWFSEKEYETFGQALK